MQSTGNASPEGSAALPEGETTRVVRSLDSPPTPALQDNRTSPGTVAQPPSPLHLTETTQVPFPPSSSTSSTAFERSSSRSSAHFQPSRPAPPSPALSRRGSEINAASLLTSSPTLSTTQGGRERAGSGSSSSASASAFGSSVGARRLSQSSGLRGSGRPRPRSSLGVNAFSADSKEYADMIAGQTAPREGDETPSKEGASGAATPQTLLASPLILPGPGGTLPESVPEEEPQSASSERLPAAPAVDSDASPDKAPESDLAGEGSTAVVDEDQQGEQSPSTWKSPQPVVRDYAYLPGDQRHLGIFPPPTPASRRDSNGSSRRASSSSGTHRNSTAKRGWPGLSLLNWRFLGSGARRASATADEGVQIFTEPDDVSEPDVGNTTDDYAFASSSSSEVGDDDVSSSRQGGLARAGYYRDSGLSEFSDEDGAAIASADDALPDEPPYGLYRVAYEFEAEGENEMTVIEGEIIHVRGRGGGEGWVIAHRIPSGRPEGAPLIGQDALHKGLVPETYLDRLSATEAAKYPDVAHEAGEEEEEGDDREELIEELDEDTPRQEKHEKNLNEASRATA